MLKLRNAILVSFSVILLTLAACGGDESNDSTSNGGGSYPIVAYVSPAPGTQFTPGDSVVFDIYFDEEMDGGTINGSSVVLKNGLGAVIPATIFHEKSHVRLTPATPLICGIYTLYVYDTVKSTAGVNMQYDYMCSIYDDSTWGTAMLIETVNTGHSYNPQMVIDSNGNVTTIWTQYEGTYTHLWANRYTEGTGWGTAELIETNYEDIESDKPPLAVDSNGNVTAVWLQHDGTRSHLWANRYTPGTGWGTEELIETDNTVDAKYPNIVVDSNGNVTAVWSQDDGTLSHLWANRYTEGTGWGTAELIEKDNDESSPYALLAVDSTGNVTAVWSQNDGTLWNIWANRYAAGTGWGTEQLIETDNTGSADNLQLKIDSNGNVTAVWSQHDGTSPSIWANRYTVGTGWGTAELIETYDSDYVSQPRLASDSSGNLTLVWIHNVTIYAKRYNIGTGWGTTEPIKTYTAGYPINSELAVDSTGNVTVVWSQNDGTLWNIWANRYAAGTGWGTEQLIETYNAGGASSPQLAVDSNGNVTAAWSQHDGTRNNIWANRYTSGTGWGTAQLIETDNAGSAYSPQLTVDSNGNVTVVWRQSDGTHYNIWANRFE